jgi:Rrf2 family protein
MALNTRFATGIEALVLLAAEPGKLHRSEDVARKLKTNPVVIRRAFLQLRKAGLVLSHKGPSGGSKLGRPAKEITLRDVHRAVHPHGLLHASPSSATPGLQPMLKSIFGDASRAFEKELDEITLSQLAKKALKKSKH